MYLLVLCDRKFKRSNELKVHEFKIHADRKLISSELKNHDIKSTDVKKHETIQAELISSNFSTIGLLNGKDDLLDKMSTVEEEGIGSYKDRISS